MSDPTDDLTLLASAYLDGEATPDERALVETSVDALAEVERLARVRTVLEATVEPVALAAREAHLAAALLSAQDGEIVVALVEDEAACETGSCGDNCFGLSACPFTAKMPRSYSIPLSKVD